jgi:hypothetical protein
MTTKENSPSEQPSRIGPEKRPLRISKQSVLYDLWPPPAILFQIYAKAPRRLKLALMGQRPGSRRMRRQYRPALKGRHNSLTIRFRLSSKGDS